MTTPPYDTRTQPLSAQLPTVVSEAQRAFVVQRISEAYVTDRITEEQLDGWLARVYEAPTVHALDQMVAELDAPVQYGVVRAGDMRVAHEFSVPERGIGVAVMGGFQRGAGWVVPRHFKVVAVMGGVELDLRDARLGAGVTQIDAYALMGGVEILVPNGVRVECVGAAVMGGFGATTDAANLDDPNAPVLRISGIAVMAGVEIIRKKPKRKNTRAFVQALEKAERARPRRG